MITRFFVAAGVGILTAVVVTPAVLPPGRRPPLILPIMLFYIGAATVYGMQWWRKSSGGVIIVSPLWSVWMFICRFCAAIIVGVVTCPFQFMYDVVYLWRGDPDTARARLR